MGGKRYGLEHRLQDVPPEVAPRRARGCDHGVGGSVIARAEDNSVLLVWRKGHKGFQGRGMEQAYYPAQLELFHGEKPQQSRYLGDVLLEGGRLTRFRIQGIRSVLSKAFGVTDLHNWLLQQGRGIPKYTTVVHPHMAPLTCPTHGRMQWINVTTTKTCGLCAEGARGERGKIVDLVRTLETK